MTEQVNRRDLAKIISNVTGFTIKDVEEVLAVEDEVICELISEGIEIKKHKSWKIEIETRKAKQGWDGFSNKPIYIPEKQIIKFKPLSDLKEAIDKLNRKTYEDNEEQE